MLLPVYCWFGLASVVITVGGILLSMEGFLGMKKEKYSFLNHFISELGDGQFAKHNRMFNISMFLGGILFMPFVFGIASLIPEQTFSVIVLIVGLVATAGLSLVGIFPEEKEKRHIVVAAIFFLGTALLMLLFIIGSFIQQFSLFPSWMTYASIAELVFPVTFLTNTALLPKEEMEKTYKPWNWDPGTRPRFWLNPFLEWCSLVAMVSWLVSIVILCF